jgi:hypothetical protein
VNVLQTIDYIGDVLFWLDIGLNFVTPYFEDGFLITDDKLIVCVPTQPLPFLPSAV